MKIRIFYLSTEINLDLSKSFGAKVHVCETVKALRKLGHTVYLDFPRWNKKRQALRSAYSRINKVFFLRTISFCFRSCFGLLEDYRNYKRLCKFLKQENFDVIYERHSGACFAGFYLARKYKIPRVVDVIGRIEQNQIYYNHPRNPVSYYMQAKLLNAADAITTSSSFMKDYLQCLGIPLSKITCITNGFDETKFSPDTLSNDLSRKLNLNQKVVVGYSGSFSPWMGLEWLIDLFPRLVASYPNIHLLIIGDGDNRQALERSAFLNGTKDNVTFVGRIPHEEVAKYLKILNIAVIPNSNPSGSPAKLFEYMAMGKAIVAPNLPPIMDVLEDGVDVELFAPNNETQFLNAIELLIKNGSYRAKIGQAARRKAIDNFSWTKCVKILESVFLRSISTFNSE